MIFCSNTDNQSSTLGNNSGAIPKKRSKFKSQSTSEITSPSQILKQSRAAILESNSAPTKRIRQNSHRKAISSQFDEIDLGNEMSPNTRHLLEIRRELNYQGDVLSNIVRDAHTHQEVGILILKLLQCTRNLNRLNYYLVKCY